MPTKQLQSEWAQALKDSGFKDAEDAEGNLKVFHSQRFERDYDRTTHFAKQTYFELCAQFGFEYKFESIQDKIIWQYHCAGRSAKYISNKMKISSRYIQEFITKLDYLVKS